MKKNKVNEAPDIRCFCKKHADEYRNSGIYILRRPDYIQTVMDKCDKCDRLGFDYILVDKPSPKQKGSVWVIE